MMGFNPNKGKKLEIQIGEDIYYRYPIKTHQVGVNESYLEIIKTYVLPIYEEGDIVSISEKIISLCQNRVVYKKDLKPGFWARLLCRFVTKSTVKRPVKDVYQMQIYKMQVAINQVGLIRILVAALCGAVTKLFGYRGVFYKIAGHGVSGIDGFCGVAFKEYLEMGILNPENPNGVCNEIKRELGITAMIVDANDLGIEILGKADIINHEDAFLKDLIGDNPAGQGSEQTPIIIIRKESALELASTTKEPDLEFISPIKDPVLELATSTDEQGLGLVQSVSEE